MPIHYSVSQLRQIVADNADWPEQLVQHINECPLCAERLDEATRSEHPLLLYPDQPREEPTFSMPTTLRAGDRLANYVIIGKLGSGGMGEVYQAQELGLNRLVALKLIRMDKETSAEARVRFLQEAETLANLQHPGIVSIFHLCPDEQRPFFAFEFCSGGSLADRLLQSLLPLSQALGLVRDIAQAVDAAHKAGIIHRDLKPSNILFDSGGIAKVADFGIARSLLVESKLTQTHAALGAPSYAAPEQLQGHNEKVRETADVYSLGAILYECLTRWPPFVGEEWHATTLRVISEEPLEPRQFDPKIPHAVQTICLKCLEKQPERRYATAKELAADIQRFLDDEPIVARPVSKGERLIRWSRQNPLLSSGFLFLLVMVVVFGISSWLLAAAWQRAQDAESVRVVSDGALEVASGDEAGTVRLTDAQSGKHTVLTKYNSRVVAVVSSRDGKTLFCCGGQEIRIFDCTMASCCRLSRCR